jgi:hypothetical protein
MDSIETYLHSNHSAPEYYKYSEIKDKHVVVTVILFTKGNKL